MARIPLPGPDEMNPAQRRVHDEVVAGPRGSLVGPLRAVIHWPAPADPEQQVIYDFATEMHETHTVSQKTYAHVLERFGTLGVVQLTALLGYYTMVAMTLNAHEIPLPEGAAPPLPAPRGAA